MKKAFHFFFALAILSLAKSSCAQGKYETVKVSGFNINLVANDDGSIDSNHLSTITDAVGIVGMDGEGSFFTSENFNHKGFKPGYFLPSDRMLYSDSIKGLDYKLESYDHKNALQLKNDAGHLNFNEHLAADTLYVLGLSGGDSCDVVFTIHFSDGTLQRCDTAKFPECFYSKYDITLHELFNAREKFLGVYFDNFGFTRATLPIDQANKQKKIAKISVKASGEGLCNIMAVSVRH